MNAPAFPREPLERKTVLTGVWTDDPFAQALIVSCAKRPPARMTHFDTYVLTRDEWSTYEGTRVNALRHVRDRYAADLLPACDREYLRTRDHFAYAPMDQHSILTVEKVIGDAVAARSGADGCDAIEADMIAEDARQIGGVS